MPARARCEGVAFIEFAVDEASAGQLESTFRALGFSQRGRHRSKDVTVWRQDGINLVVNREREATPETPSWNVVVVTTGIARRWLTDDLVSARDTVVVDEIHQTSAELELCLALGKRIDVRFNDGKSARSLISIGKK